MSKVTATAGLAKGHMEQIQAASIRQTDAADQISSSLGQLEQISQSTAASAEETATSGVELSVQTGTLREIVTILQQV
jgi:methyl-accepting chemotaxis protein